MFSPDAEDMIAKLKGLLESETPDGIHIGRLMNNLWEKLPAPTVEQMNHTFLVQLSGIELTLLTVAAIAGVQVAIEHHRLVPPQNQPKRT